MTKQLFFQFLKYFSFIVMLAYDAMTLSGLFSQESLPKDGLEVISDIIFNIITTLPVFFMCLFWVPFFLRKRDYKNAVVPLFTTLVIIVLFIRMFVLKY